MNICMIVYHYYPVAAGGAEHQCRLQARALAEQGHNCRVLTVRSCFAHSSQEDDGGVSIFRINTLQALLSCWIDLKKKRKRSAAVFKRPSCQVTRCPSGKESEYGGMISAVVRWVNALCFMSGVSWHVWRNKKSIDILHTHVASWNAGFTAWLGARLGIPVICKASYLPAFHDFGRSIPFSNTWRRWRNGASFAALTDEMANDIAANGVPADRIHVIPNGVLIPEDACAVERFQRVLYVGNFTQGSHHKGFDILLPAWANVAQAVPDARLVIAGGGDATPWKRLAVELKCGESVDFVGHVTDLAPLYLSSGVFVLPSRGEGISNALLESQSYGIPAVVSDIPGNLAVVKERRNGIVIPVEDVPAFSKAIIRMLEDRELRRKMGDRARFEITAKFSIESVARKYELLYQTLRATP
jgi:glycosyltransferase involved in cell wall biosynthesis